MEKAHLWSARRMVYSRLFVWFAAALVILVCIIRFAQAPSFWLDEAWIAVELREPSLQSIFSRLPKGLYFPRLYLSVIAGLRELLGYRIWALRLLPSLFFITATMFWARLLAKRCGALRSTNLLAGSLLIGSFFWLEQAIELKPYSLDVLVALIPFLLSDHFYESGLSQGSNKTKLILLTCPGFFSYTYPLVLLARVLGWYLRPSGQRRWKLSGKAVSIFLGFIALGFISIYITDYQFNFKDSAAYYLYWDKCILHAQLRDGIGSSLRLLGDFFWGWHSGRLQPLVLAAIVPLQILGLYRVLSRWKTAAPDDAHWGSRSLGALALLSGIILASLLVNYPICAGRLLLFAQVHLQVLALEGVLLLHSSWNKHRAAQIFIYASIAVIAVYSVHRYVRFIGEEPRENLRVLLPLIKPEMANTIWVEPCAVGQVRSLPDPLPVENIILKTREQNPPLGERVWVLWANVSDEDCQRRLDELRAQARNWQVVHEGPGRGLALAQF
ncbi:MAG: hypothetical protein AB1757_17715 [Acidobacteriota bacterium]